MEYKKVKLKEVCTVNQGLQIPISKRFKEKGPNRYFYITIQFLKGNTDEYYIENPKKSVICQKEDILVVRTGNTGMVLTGVEGCFHNNFFKVEPNEKIYSKYLYYTLNNKYMYKKMLNAASGTTIPDLKHSAFYDLVIPLPTISEQHKIVNVLESIDEKIKLNNQINDNLHNLLKIIYHNKFIDNKKEDWIEDKLGNYLDVERGLSYKGKFLADAGTPMINLGNVMPDGVFRLEKNKYYTGEYKEKVTVTAGDIVMANTDMTQNRDVLGTPVIIPHIYNDKVIFSHHIYALKNLRLPKMYVFYSLLTKEWNGVSGGSATGTTVLALPKDAIEEYMITIPDEISLKRFEDLAENIQKTREQIIIEKLNLEQLRDTLLPKLMNGEIDLEKIKI